jgi:hypothetical protein
VDSFYLLLLLNLKGKRYFVIMLRATLGLFYSLTDFSIRSFFLAREP